MNPRERKDQDWRHNRRPGRPIRNRYHVFEALGSRIPVCKHCGKVEAHAIHHNVKYPHADPRGAAR